MNYTAILKRAFNITWRQRALWVFGILLALLGGSRAGGSGGGGNGGGAQATQMFQYEFGNSDLSHLNINWALISAIILIILAVVLILIVISIIVRYLSTGALIAMVDEVEETGTTSVRSGFRAGWARFLRLFAIALVIGLPVAIVLLALLLLVLVPLPVIIIAAQAHATALVVLGVLAMIGIFLVWLLVAIVTSAVVDLLIEFMYRRCVLAREGVFDSIREGFTMVRRNVRDAGLTWLLLFGIGLLFNIVLVPVVLLGIALGVVVGIIGWALAQTLLAAILAALPVMLIFTAAAVFVQALWIIFRSSVWTLVYREIVAREGPLA